MRGVINSYESNNESDSLTVADIIASELSNVLRGIDVLAEEKIVEITYYDVDANGIVKKYAEYDKEKNIKSLMWTIPLGT